MKAPPIRAELWIASRLRRPDLFTGTTTPEDRRERVRESILSRGLADAPVGKGRDRRMKTWADVFREVYRDDVSRGTF